MKRECNKYEKETIVRNSNLFYNEVFLLQAKGKIMKSILSFAISMAVGLLIVFRIPNLQFAKWIFGIILIASLLIIGSIVSVIYEIIEEEILKTKFLKSDVLYINGATIVNVDNENNRIIYVEDDVIDEKGEYILLSYPSNEYEIKKVQKNERVLIVYDKENNYHMMRTAKTLLEYFQIEEDGPIFNIELMKKEPFPHLNVLMIDKHEKALSFSEKETLNKNCTILYAKTDRIKYSLIGAVLICGTMLWAVIVGCTEDILLKAIIIGLSISGVIGSLIFVSYWIMIFIYNSQKKFHFTSIKEVVLDSYEFDPTSEYETIKVYEWDVNKLEQKTYKKVKCSTYMRHGAIMYKLKTTKNEIVVLLKDELIKKKMY